MTLQLTNKFNFTVPESLLAMLPQLPPLKAGERADRKEIVAKTAQAAKAIPSAGSPANPKALAKQATNYSPNDFLYDYWKDIDGNHQFSKDFDDLDQEVLRIRQILLKQLVAISEPGTLATMKNGDNYISFLNTPHDFNIHHSENPYQAIENARKRARGLPLKPVKFKVTNFRDMTNEQIDRVLDILSEGTAIISLRDGDKLWLHVNGTNCGYINYLVEEMVEKNRDVKELFDKISPNCTVWHFDMSVDDKGEPYPTMASLGNYWEKFESPKIEEAKGSDKENQKPNVPASNPKNSADKPAPMDLT